MVGVWPEVTVNPENGIDVPAEVVTTIVRRPMAAPCAIVMLTGKDVSVPPVPIAAVTPDPLKLTKLAPDRFTPEIVAEGVEPGIPPVGLIPVIAGCVPPVTVNPENGDDVPEAVVTVTVRKPDGAPLTIVIVTGRDVVVPPLPMAAVTPLPLKLTRFAPSRSVPKMVAPTVDPT